MIDKLDNFAFQILIGSILGDGSVLKQSKKSKQLSYIFHEGHSIKQKDYVVWKQKALQTSIISEVISQELRIRINRASFETRTHPVFYDLRKLYYCESTSSKRYICFDHVEKLDYLGLLVWYLDDGYMESSPYIYSTLFHYEDILKAVEIINRNLNLTLEVGCKINNKGLELKTIKFHKRNRDLIFPIWRKLASDHNLPKCMDYKFQPKKNIWTEHDNEMRRRRLLRKKSPPL